MVPLLALALLVVADPPAPPAKAALQPFNDLIGSWKGIGNDSAPREGVNDFWTEKVAWEWQFKDGDAWLRAAFTNGKHFTAGELRPGSEKDHYTLTLRTPAKETLTFAGTLADRVLTVERDAGGERHRLVLTMLHTNRHLVRFETRAEGKTFFRKQYQVGATKEGVPFASGEAGPECVVSGGLGTMPVTYMGKTYYVCCGGCRSEFQADPVRYVKEFEARKAKRP